MRYAVGIEQGINYSGYMPDLPRCVAVGDTLEEVEAEIRAAIEFHLEGMREVAGVVVRTMTRVWGASSSTRSEPVTIMHDYPVIKEALTSADGGGFLATVPDLPGCMSDGETREMAARNIEDAIASWIEEAKALGRRVPEPTRLAIAGR